MRPVGKTIIIGGYGPGIGAAVARRFGAEGFDVALVGRTERKLQAGIERLEGVKAQAFVADLGDPAAVTSTVATVREAMGPIEVVHYNAVYAQAGDLLDMDAASLEPVFALGAQGLLALVRAAREDLVAQKGAVLITGGGMANDAMNAMTNQMGLGALALGKAIHHKLAGLLHHRLAADGVYVGEVQVRAMVKSDHMPHGTVTADEVAARFWQAFGDRAEATVTVP